MAEDQLSPLRKALLASASRPLHLAVGAAGVGLALTASLVNLGGQTLPVLTLGLGLLAYGAMIALDITNPDFIRKTNARVRVAEQPPSLVPAAALRDAEMREVYTSILAAFDNCQRVYLGTSESLRSSLEDGMQRSSQLVVVAARAAKRADAIYRHLDADTPSGLNNELVRLQTLAEETGDATAKQDFLQAAQAKSKELDTYHQLRGLRDRVHAQLRLIETALDGLSAKLVKLDATDYAEAISINQSISEHVQTVMGDVEILESTFEETLQEFRI